MPGDAHIHVVSGPGEGRSVEVLIGDRASIGRELPAALVIPDPTVSKKHIELDNRADGLWIFAVGKNAVDLDGRPIPREGVRIIGDSQLKIGRSVIRITIDPPPVAPPGVVFERWLGRGASGFVFAARVEGLDVPAAVKILHETASDRVTKARLRREGAILKRLDHPAILRVHGFMEHQGRLFLIQELMSGRTLADVLERGAMPWRDAVSVGATVASALAYAHASGVIHRDVSPSNIFIDEGARAARLGDFGSAREVDGRGTVDGSSMTKTGDLLGTLNYVAPEQVGAARDVTTAVDVYALGAVLYHALSGAPPFGDVPSVDYVSAAFRGAPPLVQVAPQVPPSVSDAVMRAMNPLHEERPDAAALAKDLKGLVIR